MSDKDVAVVVDRCFGSRLGGLVHRVHTWICASEQNREAIQTVWAQGSSKSVTLFNAADQSSPEEMLIDELEVIAEHHPCWSTMEVYGAARTPQVSQALQSFGVTEFQDRAEGFTALRPDTGAA